MNEATVDHNRDVNKFLRVLIAVVAVALFVFIISVMYLEAKYSLTRATTTTLQEALQGGGGVIQMPCKSGDLSPAIYVYPINKDVSDMETFQAQRLGCVIRDAKRMWGKGVNKVLINESLIETTTCKPYINYRTITISPVKDE